MLSTPVGPTHIVRWVPPPAVGTALLALTFRYVLCSFVLFPTLTILVVLLVVAWRTPTTWISSVMVTVCCVFAALHWNSTGTCHVRCLRALRSGEQVSTQHHGYSKISLSSDLHPHCKAPKNPFISLDVMRHRLKPQAPQQSLQTEFSARAPTPRRRVYLFSLNHIKLHGLSISYAAEVLPGVILLYGSLTT